MLSSMATWLSGGKVLSNFVAGTLKSIEAFNMATDLQLDRSERAKARKRALQNVFEIGVPLAVGIGVAAVGVAVGAPQGSIAMVLPLTFLAHQVDEATGLSRGLSRVTAPLLAPVTNLVGWVKGKVKKHLKIDMTQWVEKGLHVAKPFASISEERTDLGLEALYAYSPVIQLLKNRSQEGLKKAVSVVVCDEQEKKISPKI